MCILFPAQKLWYLAGKTPCWMTSQEDDCFQWYLFDSLNMAGGDIWSCLIACLPVGVKCGRTTPQSFLKQNAVWKANLCSDSNQLEQFRFAFFFFFFLTLLYLKHVKNVVCAHLSWDGIWSEDGYIFFGESSVCGGLYWALTSTFLEKVRRHTRHRGLRSLKDVVGYRSINCRLTASFCIEIE